MAQNMIEHHASITVDAPVHQVYSLFSHFNDFPKFMSFVKEVTYYDDQRSHWVADVTGQHEWDAVNEEWIPDRQIGWRSVNGLNNYGRVIFQPASTQQTHIDVYVNYQPPVGFLGNIGEHLGVGKHFDDVLQTDLNHFAEMVHQSPSNALDPTSSDYLFHDESAAARGETTERQDATMAAGVTDSGYSSGTQGDITRSEPTTSMRDETFVNRPDIGATTQSDMPQSEEALVDRPITDRDIISEPANVAPAESQQAVATGEPDLADRPVLDRDIISEPANIVPPESQQAIATGEPGLAGRATMGHPDINPVMPPNQTSQDAPDLPPEQIPRWEGPEGEQPQR